jgi:peptidoglycan/LPS O-acetylase OafA/YrhL
LQALISGTTEKPRQTDSAIVSGHLPALDGLRGIAILLVMVFHFTESYLHSLGGVLYKASNVGWCGVDLFFVLSGFLITGILYDAKNDGHYFRKFYMRRVLRIFPLYYGYLFAIFVLWPLAHQYSGFVHKDISEEIRLWSYLTNYDYAFFSHPLITKFHLAHFWSLAIEEQFYLIWPFVIFFCPLKTAVRVCLAGILVALLTRLFLVAGHVNPIVIFNLTPCRMDSLSVGALCALLIRADLNLSKLLRGALLIALFSGAGLLLLLSRRGESDPDSPLMQSIGYSLFAFFFAGITLLSLRSSKDSILAWLLSCPLLALFGFYSYAIYVFHYPLVQTFDQWFPVETFSSHLHSRTLGIAAHVLCSVLVSLFIAVLSWNLYEKHFLKLKKYFVLSGAKRIGTPGGPRSKTDSSLVTSGLLQSFRVLNIWFHQRPF